MRTTATIAFAALLSVVSSISAEQKQPEAIASTSPTCGPLTGKGQADIDHLKELCEKAVMKTLGVTSASAMDSLVWLKVNRSLADQMRSDRVSAEALVKAWMRGWKTMTGSKAVTVTVEWGDVQIAKGSTSLLGTDSVTIR